jgi:hypothetical protein
MGALATFTPALTNSLPDQLIQTLCLETERARLKTG